MESKEKSLPNRGYFLKIMVQILICYLEESVRANDTEKTEMACQQIESLLIFLLIVGENVRDKSLGPQRKSFIIASILNLFQILFRLLEITTEGSEIRQIIVGSIKNVVMHLMCIVDYINQRTGKFGSISSNADTVNSPNVKQTFTMITHDIITNYLVNEDEPIITVQMIKNLKFNDFTSIGAIILTEEWKKTPVQNQKINQIINEHYSNSLENITSDLARQLEDRTMSQALRNNKVMKKNEEVEKKFGIEIVEIALEVYEQEDEKRQENLANDEECVRTAKNMWKKLWKRMRVYVGQWRHPLVYDQEDYKFDYEKESFANMPKNTLFTHKISKYESKTRARPFVKIKLIEPAYVEEYNRLLSSKRGNIRSLINNLRPNVFFAQSNTPDLPMSSNKKFSFKDIQKNIKKTFKSMAGGSQASPWNPNLGNRPRKTYFFIIIN